MYIGLAAKLEATNKALTEEKSSWQVVDQTLLAAQESNTSLRQDLQVVQASTAALN
jgi:hypothetical protein